MEASDLAILECAPMKHWKLILDLIKERREYELKFKIEARKTELLRRKYEEIVKKQEQALGRENEE